MHHNFTPTTITKGLNGNVSTTTTHTQIGTLNGGHVFGDSQFGGNGSDNRGFIGIALRNVPPCPCVVILHAHAVERAEPPHQHEIEPAVGAGALDRGLVDWAYALTKDVVLPDNPDLAALRAKAAQNAACLDAAISGVKSARRRLREIAQAEMGLTTYDREGAKAVHLAAPSASRRV